MCVSFFDTSSLEVLSSYNMDALTAQCRTGGLRLAPSSAILAKPPSSLEEGHLLKDPAIGLGSGLHNRSKLPLTRHGRRSRYLHYHAKPLRQHVAVLLLRLDDPLLPFPIGRRDETIITERETSCRSGK